MSPCSASSSIHILWSRFWAMLRGAPLVIVRVQGSSADSIRLMACLRSCSVRMATLPIALLQIPQRTVQWLQPQISAVHQLNRNRRHFVNVLLYRVSDLMDRFWAVVMQVFQDLVVHQNSSL